MDHDDKEELLAPVEGSLYSNGDDLLLYAEPLHSGWCVTVDECFSQDIEWSFWPTGLNLVVPKEMM